MNITNFLSSFGNSNNKHSLDYISREFKRFSVYLVPDYFLSELKDRAEITYKENVLITVLLAIASCFFPPH